jgi:hypothetical protein
MLVKLNVKSASDDPHKYATLVTGVADARNS